MGSEKQDEEQKSEEGLEIEEKVKGEEASKEVAELNALCNLADSLPDSSSEKFYNVEEEEVGPAVTEHNEEEEVLQQDEEHFDCLDDSTRGQIGNLDDQRHRSNDNEGEDQEVLDEVGAVDNGAGNGGEVSTSGAKGPDPPYPVSYTHLTLPTSDLV